MTTSYWVQATRTPSGWHVECSECGVFARGIRGDAAADRATCRHYKLHGWAVA